MVENSEDSRTWVREQVKTLRTDATSSSGTKMRIEKTNVFR
ncbi:hypothetical protein E2C01_030758 [Portunus trituberculatus]|uniref:Uncharacterized protein n=1 Tax=Portunus trituberculatus TaxID=210409 RepID=A0A5B7EY87_PORTR|nr:hypothetical protein [Portunus trituberculatus]